MARRTIWFRWALPALAVILVWLGVRAAEPKRRHPRSPAAVAPARADATPLDRPGGELKDLALPGADLHGAVAQRATLLNVDLSGANLSGASFTRSFLSFVNLDRANLAGADLRRCAYDRFTRWPAGFDPRAAGAINVGPGADLHGADLHGVNLTGACLVGADLRGANLGGASLRRSFLYAADLRGARGVGTDYRFADLSSADLRDLDLSRALLKGALYDRQTLWPARFDPKAAGAVYME